MTTSGVKGSSKFLNRLCLFDLYPQQHVNDLPFDIIIYQIFCRLPVKSLLRFRRLSKLYRETIDDPDFIRTHHARASHTRLVGWTSGSMLFQLSENDCKLLGPTTRLFGKETTWVHPICFELNRVLCAAEGFLLLLLLRGDKVCLCNPSRRESINLESVSRAMKETRFRDLGLGVGLGFDSSSSMTEYKIVLILREENGKDMAVLIYSSKTESWKKTTNSLPPLYVGDYDMCGGVFLNGSIHWLDCRLGSVNLLSFDAKTEEFSLVALDFLTAPYCRGKHLTQLGGCLAIGQSLGVLGYGPLEKVWMLLEGKWKIMKIECMDDANIHIFNSDERGRPWFYYRPYYYVKGEGSKWTTSSILMSRNIVHMIRCKETLLSFKDARKHPYPLRILE